MTDSKMILKNIDRTSERIMKHVHSIMRDDEASSYYVADDDIDKLTKLATAYGEQTGSHVINRKTFINIRLSNGIVEMHDLRKRLNDLMEISKQNRDVNMAIKTTQKLDHIASFDFTMRYGCDSLPANQYYGSDERDVIPQIAPETAIEDMEDGEENTVSPDEMYLFLKDLRRCFVADKED